MFDGIWKDLLLPRLPAPSGRPRLMKTRKRQVVTIVAALWLAAACASVGRPPDGSAAAASAQKPVLLTFDDGPDPVWTPRILKVLHSQHVHAVFCVTGEHASMWPALIRQIVADGDTLCVHSWDHPHMLTLPAAAQHREIARTQTLLESLVGAEKVRYWRAPYGQSSAALDAFARTLGLSPLGWNAEGLDWVPGITSAKIVSLEAADLARRPLRQWARPPGNTPLGIAVVLLHDAQGENHNRSSAARAATVTAVQVIINHHAIATP